MVNGSKFSGISPEQARKELAEIAKRMGQQKPQPVKKSNNSRTYKKHFEKIIFAEKYLNGIKKNHPNSEIINIPPGERGEYTFMIKDSMKQLAMIGITQDAEDPDKKFNAFIQKHGWPTNYEESKALLEKAKKEGIHPDYIHGMERGLKAMTNKDDDATKHGSVETYGKEKETETMPLEKNPVQAQDAMIYKDQKGNIWQVVENTGANFYGLKCTAGPRKGEKIYVNGKDLQSMQRVEDEAPANVKDSYEMLKLCGIITNDAYNPNNFRVGQIVGVESREWQGKITKRFKDSYEGDSFEIEYVKVPKGREDLLGEREVFSWEELIKL